MGEYLSRTQLPPAYEVKAKGVENYVPSNQQLKNFHEIYGIYDWIKKQETSDEYNKMFNDFENKLKGAIGEHVINKYTDDVLEKFKNNYVVEEIKTVEQLNKYFDNDSGNYKAYISGENTNNKELIIKDMNNDKIKTEIDKLVVLRDKTGKGEDYIINFEFKTSKWYKGDFYDVADNIIGQTINNDKLEKIKRKKYDLLINALKPQYKTGAEKLNVMLMYIVPEGELDTTIDRKIVESGMNGGVFEVPVKSKRINQKKEYICRQIEETYKKLAREMINIKKYFQSNLN